MKTISISDLLVVTTVVAFHFAHFPLAVAYPESRWNLPVALIPTQITLWIHLRFRLRLFAASLCSYFVSIAWSFLYGWGYCVALNEYNRRYQTNGRTFDTISWALGDMFDMAAFAILTSILYFAVGSALRAIAGWLALLRGSKRQG